jgi:Domain of unknown function (DUF5615)
MARLYANENFPLPVVEELRQLGYDVLTTSESGKAGVAIPDAEVLAFAVAEGRALLTLNRGISSACTERHQITPASSSAHTIRTLSPEPIVFTRHSKPTQRSQVSLCGSIVLARIVYGMTTSARPYDQPLQPTRTPRRRCVSH